MRMKLAIILMFFGLAQANAQDTPLLINEYFQQLPLAQVFEHLEERYGLRLAYDNRITQGIVVDQRIENMPLEEALGQLLQPRGLAFQLIGQKEVLIRPRAPDKKARGERELTGQAVDALNGEPLPYATILIENTGKGAAADENGRFRLHFPAGQEKALLQAQFIGYETKKFQISLKEENNSCLLRLQPRALNIEAVTVLQKPPLLSTGRGQQAFSLDAGQLNNLPDFLGGSDLMRQLQLLPGINAHNDLSAGLQVRGSSEDANMIRLDGITLYRVDHFFGIFSAINADMVDEVKLYKNAFPAEFGGRTGGVLDISTKSPGEGRWIGRAELNLLMANAYLALPLRPSMSLTLSGRITNRDVADSRLFGLIEEEATLTPRFSEGLPSGNSLLRIEPDFNFHDLYAKWEWAPTAADQFSASFFHSYDEFQYAYDQQFSRLLRGRLVRNREVYREQAHWANTGASLQWEHQWTAKWRSEANLSYSTFENSGEVQSRFSRLDGMLSVASFANRQFNAVEGLGFRWKNDWLLPEGQQFSAGYEWLYNESRFEFDVEGGRLREGQQAAHQHTLYAQYQRQWGESWSASLGLRGTHYQADGNIYWSPRLQLGYLLNEEWSLKGSLSHYQQFLREANYEDRFGRIHEFWVLGNEANFPIARATQGMLGFTFRKNGFEFDVEGYERYLEGEVAYALPAPGFGDSTAAPSALSYRLFRGEGRSRGIDLLLKKEWDNYTGWISYTLSKTTQNYQEINRNQPFPAQDDRRHQLKWANILELGRWNLSATYVFASGRPYTDISRFERQEDRRDVDIGDFITYLKDYHRADLGLNYTFPFLGAKGEAGLSVFNLFNRSNIQYRQYIYSLPREEALPLQSRNVVLGTELELLPRTFNLSLAIKY